MVNKSLDYAYNVESQLSEPEDVEPLGMFITDSIFEDLFADEQKYLLKRCYYLANDFEMAEDLAAEIWYQFYKTYVNQGIAVESSVQVLHGIKNNVFKKYFKAKKKNKNQVDLEENEIIDNVTPPDLLLGQKLFVEDVYTVLNRLVKIQRLVWILRYDSDNFTSIIDELDVSHEKCLQSLFFTEKKGSYFKEKFIATACGLTLWQMRRYLNKAEKKVLSEVKQKTWSVLLKTYERERRQ